MCLKIEKEFSSELDIKHSLGIRYTLDSKEIRD